MLREEYQISFNTPGFVGDAEHQSAWRTPPLKALLQHWWRVAVAKQYGYDWQKIREAEGRLFGHAWLKDGNGKDWAMRSRVRLKLAHQNTGSLKHWENSPASNNITHREVKDKNTGKLRPMRPETYLAYGPLHFANGLTHPPAINAKEQNQLTLSYPEEANEGLAHALQLIHWFGTLGGRSRNAWGSVELHVGATPSSRQTPLHDYNVLLNGNADLTRFQRALKDCLTQEWPHAIGTDEKGVLIWKTEASTSWMAVMRKLAEIKISYRTSLNVIKPFDERQVLALPVTHHTPKELKNDRIASQMRMKVIQHQNQYYGLIFHLPCKIPLEISGKLKGADAQSLIANQAAIWCKVHQHLDNQLQRTGSR